MKRGDIGELHPPLEQMVPRASTVTMGEDMNQRLADDDAAYALLKKRLEGLNLYDDFKNVIPYAKAKPRDILISQPAWNDHPVIKQILEWAHAYRTQCEYSKKYRAMADHRDASLEDQMKFMDSAMKADKQAAEYRKGIDDLFKDAFKVLSELHKKRLDAALTQSQMKMKHAHHKDVLAAKGFGDPLQSSSDDLLRIANAKP